jgi:hypothetical protein
MESNRDGPSTARQELQFFAPKLLLTILGSSFIAACGIRLAEAIRLSTLSGFYCPSVGVCTPYPSTAPSHDC